MSWNKAKTVEMIEIMKVNYPNADCALKFGSIFQLLIAVVLSAQTTDKQVNVVTQDLFARYPDAKSMATAEEEDLSEIIRRIGMYRTKARNILRIAEIIQEKYQGVVPESYEELVTLPGVGRKTANVVMSVGFGVPAIAVDTHVFRVSNRIGVVKEKDVLKTEMALMKALPRDCWTDMHHALIWHGRLVCSARNPKCSGCVLNHICEYNKKMQVEREKAI